MGETVKALEALERAAKGKGDAAAAAKVLLQDKDMDAELRQKAKEALAARDITWQTRDARLRWIGPAAVPAIAETFFAQPEDKRQTPERSRRCLANLIWMFGGRYAPAFFERALKSDLGTRESVMLTAP
ncbi:MAG: hypothetical protein IIC70_10940, partial [Acidobacteria bacterium]|nr:hypothetical protein [Acidobacteriota bacterium]